MVRIDWLTLEGSSLSLSNQNIHCCVKGDIFVTRKDCDVISALTDSSPNPSGLQMVTRPDLTSWVIFSLSPPLH